MFHFIVVAVLFFLLVSSTTSRPSFYAHRRIEVGWIVCEAKSVTWQIFDYYFGAKPLQNHEPEHASECLKYSFVAVSVPKLKFTLVVVWRSMRWRERTRSDCSTEHFMVDWRAMKELSFSWFLHFFLALDATEIDDWLSVCLAVVYIVDMAKNGRI